MLLPSVPWRLNLESGQHTVHSDSASQISYMNGWFTCGKSSHTFHESLVETFGQVDDLWYWWYWAFCCFCIVQWLLDDSCSFYHFVTRRFQFVFVSQMSGWLLWPRGIWRFSPRVVLSHIFCSHVLLQEHGSLLGRHELERGHKTSRHFQNWSQQVAREVECHHTESYPFSLLLMVQKSCTNLIGSLSQ